MERDGRTRRSGKTIGSLNLDYNVPKMFIVNGFLLGILSVRSVPERRITLEQDIGRVLMGWVARSRDSS